MTIGSLICCFHGPIKACKNLAIVIDLCFKRIEAGNMYIGIEIDGGFGDRGLSDGEEE